MQTKIVSSKILLMVVFGGFVLFATFLFYFIQQRFNLPIKNVVTFSEQEQGSFGLPVRLKIPKIDVDAKVEFMGLTPDGAMEAPKKGRNLGWYSAGSRPGEVGSAVMDGHYGTWKNGEGSVFDNLNKLEKGDRVYVEDGEGTTTTFVVRESRSFDPNADAREVFDSSDKKAHLNLITCEGIWNKDSKSYSERLVVFTDKE